MAAKRTESNHRLPRPLRFHGNLRKPWSHLTNSRRELTHISESSKNTATTQGSRKVPDDCETLVNRKRLTGEEQEHKKTLGSRRSLASSRGRQASACQGMTTVDGSLVPLRATRSGSVSSLFLFLARQSPQPNHEFRKCHNLKKRKGICKTCS